MTGEHNGFPTEPFDWESWATDGPTEVPPRQTDPAPSQPAETFSQQPHQPSVAHTPTPEVSISPPGWSGPVNLWASSHRPSEQPMPQSRPAEHHPAALGSGVTPPRYPSPRTPAVASEPEQPTRIAAFEEEAEGRRKGRGILVAAVALAMASGGYLAYRVYDVFTDETSAASSPTTISEEQDPGTDELIVPPSSVSASPQAEPSPSLEPSPSASVSSDPSPSAAPSDKPSKSPTAKPTKKPTKNSSPAAPPPPIYRETDTVAAVSRIDDRNLRKLTSLIKREGAGLVGLHGNDLADPDKFGTLREGFSSYERFPKSRFEADQSPDAALLISKEEYDVVSSGYIRVPQPNAHKLSNRGEAWPFALVRAKSEDAKPGQLIFVASARFNGEETKRTVQKSHGKLDRNGKIKREKSAEILYTELQGRVAKIQEDTGETVEVVLLADTNNLNQKIAYPTTYSLNKPNSVDCVIAQKPAEGNIGLTTTKGYEAGEDACSQLPEIGSARRIFMNSDDLTSTNAYFGFNAGDRDVSALFARFNYKVELPREKKS